MQAADFSGKEEKLQKLDEVFLEVARNISVKMIQFNQTLTPPQFFLLKKLSSGPATVSEVADYMGVSLSAITSMSDRLVKLGYVARKRSENDRRLVWLELTAAGGKVLAEAMEKRKEVVYGFLGKLPEEDLAALHGIYTKLLELIRENKE